MVNEWDYSPEHGRKNVEQHQQLSDPYHKCFLQHIEKFASLLKGVYFLRPDNPEVGKNREHKEELPLKESLHLGFNFTCDELNSLQTFHSFIGNHVPLKQHALLSWTGELISLDDMRINSLKVFKHPILIEICWHKLPNQGDSSST